MITMFALLPAVPVVDAGSDNLIPIEQVKFTFNNTGKGWSVTNSTVTQLTRVTSPDNSTSITAFVLTPVSRQGIFKIVINPPAE